MKVGARLLPRFKNKSSIIRAAVEWNRFFIPAKKTSDVVAFKDKKSFIFGTASCLKPQKNIFDLLKAFKLMSQRLALKKQERKPVLHIVGDGVLRDSIEKWISDNELEGVKLLGWQRDVASLMRSWDVFVLSSLWEGLPCAVIEARLCGLPVVAYDVGGIADIIHNDCNGFLIKPGDVKDFECKMEMLVSDFTLYHRLSAYKDDLYDFKDQFMVHSHLELYKKLL